MRYSATFIDIETLPEYRCACLLVLRGELCRVRWFGGMTTLRLFEDALCYASNDSGWAACADVVLPISKFTEVLYQALI